MQEQHEKERKRKAYFTKAFAMAGGALAGGVLGGLTGFAAKDDIALFVGFGMMVGLGLAVDILAHIEKNGKME